MSATIIVSSALILSLAGLAHSAPKAETYRGVAALGYSRRVPMKHLKHQLRRERLSARGLPAAVLQARLALHRLVYGARDHFEARVQAALNQPMSTG